MEKELNLYKCGLNFNDAELNVFDSKNFGPERLKAMSAKVFCEYSECPLRAGIEINIPLLTAETYPEMENKFVNEAKDPSSRLTERITTSRIQQCPYYGSQFGTSKVS